MNNLVFIFGILSVALLQATALPGTSSSTDPNNGDLKHLLMKQFAEQDGLYDNFVGEVHRNFDASPVLIDPNQDIQLNPWCAGASKMDLFVQSLCVVKDPRQSVKRLLAALTKLSPEKLVPYVADMLKRWGYIVHKDYQAVLGRKGNFDEDIKDLEEWYSVRSYLMEASGETDRTLDLLQRKSNLQFPKGHFNKDVYPMLNGQFEVNWVNIFEISDLELLRLSPYLLTLKHGELSELRYLFLYVWGVLRKNDMLKGPDSVLGPVVNSYPFYFRTDLNIFGTSVDQLTSVWNRNFHHLKGIMDAPYFLVISLLPGNFEKLDEALGMYKSELEPIAAQAKKEIAILLYSLAQHFFPRLQEIVEQVLTRFLDEGDFQQMKYLFFEKRKRETRPVFEHGSVTILSEFVRVLGNEQVEVAMINILPLT
ncbi:hypothetical protein IWQ61_001250 [Dispira simplex]|nr:hypothetical protein IWQ61_001250 [Dispira simplex]